MGPTRTVTVTSPPVTVTNTVIKTKVKVVHVKPKPKAPAPSSMPGVVGLSVPAAEHLLRAAGFRYDAVGEDGLFGIIVPQNWTVCSVARVGRYVTLHAYKYGCP
jgi:beta-lactam-binding protein with PASTA domain